MGCCNSHAKDQPYQGNSPIDYSECLRIFAEQKDPVSFLNTLCKTTFMSQNGNNNAGGNEGPSPGFQCVVVPVAGLCQEITIFDLSHELLHKIIKCTFASIFSRLGPELLLQVYTQYEIFLSGDDGIPLSTFSNLLTHQLHQLYTTYKETGNGLGFYKYLNSSQELKELTSCDNPETNYSLLITYLAKAKFLEELAEEFTKTEFTLCQKFLRIEIDLVILLNRITELSTNTQGGISGITEALRRVAIGPANRYFVDNDFDDLFEAAEEVADVLEQLAALYRERFHIFAELSQDLLCSRPQPPVQSIIREIPTLPPTVIL